MPLLFAPAVLSLMHNRTNILSVEHNFVRSCRLLQQLLHLAWPSSAASLDISSTQPSAVQSTAAVASCLSLLQQLVGTYSSTARLLGAALHNCQDLGLLMVAGLTCGLEAVVVPLLQ